MRRWVLFLLVFMVSASNASGTALPSDGEVKVALQSVLVAAAATVASDNLVPPLKFEDAAFESDSSFSNFTLVLDHSDVGLLRKRVLESPSPPPRQMGFLEALFVAVVPILPDYYRMVEFLRPQALGEREIVLTGTLEALRLSTPYPFRYEGRGVVDVTGSRIRSPFTLDFSFVIPLEGPAGSAIIPTRVTANGEDYLDVAKSLFKTPFGVDLKEELKFLQ